ncbi:MAG: c-type cytochrome [Caldilineaceae bacterium]|nr:c-type cytochrome [Caldilineaceae bacterium]
MRRIRYLFVLIFVVVLVLSCGRSAPEEPTVAPEPTIAPTEAPTATVAEVAPVEEAAPAEEVAAEEAPAEAVDASTSVTETESVVAELIDPTIAVHFAVLPEEAATGKYPLSTEMTDLGRMLFYEPRLSLAQDISCNTCHLLDNYGVDGLPTSVGHLGAVGGRNAPTVYNAALEVAQFWDGRSPDVEDQAKGPIQNQIEMGMPTGGAEAAAVIKSIPGYEPLFAAAFPDDPDPITFENLTTAIAAFERKLMTPGRFDAFLAGDGTQLTEQEKAGLQKFVSYNCTMCHRGPTVGGQMYMKLGLYKPYPTEDLGRYDVTQNEADKYVFKVSMLRNIEKTGPYFHDGSIATLEEAVKIMGEYQLGQTISDEDVADIVAFLKSLTGEVPMDYIAPPVLPENGPDTPAPVTE